MLLIIGIILCIGFLVITGFILDYADKAEQKRRHDRNYEVNVKRIQEWLDNWYSAILELTEEYKNYTGDITFEYYAVKSDYFYYYTGDEYVNIESAYEQPHFDRDGNYHDGRWGSRGYDKATYGNILISPVEQNNKQS